MIGISLSACIADMGRGDVKPEFVSRIIAGTAHEFRNPYEMNEQINFYRSHRWRDCADEAERLFREFWADGKIEQPRLTEGRFPDVETMATHWVDLESDITWVQNESIVPTILGNSIKR